jgi:arsenite methyltransferase
VLKRGGRLAVSDMVATTQLPEEVRRDLAFYTGCLAGAAAVEDLRRMLADAGFTRISIRLKSENEPYIQDATPGRKIEDSVVSAILEATKP